MFRGTSAELLLKNTVQYKVLFLPNDKIKDSWLLTEALEQESFDYVISFGQRPNIKDKVYMETTAGKGDLYISTAFEYEKWKKVLEQNGLVVKISNSAGTSFCNELYWNGLRYIGQNRLDTKMAFVHVPFEKNVTDMEAFREKLFRSLEGLK